MTDYHYRPSVGYDWDEHNVIQPLLVLAIRGGVAPAAEIILHQNAIDRGLMQLDLFGDVHFTDAGEKVLEAYQARKRLFIFYD